MDDQGELLTEREWDYLLITDAGRYDVFAELIDGFDIDGTLEQVHNGGHAFTATWFAEHFYGEYDFPLFHGGHPIWSFKTNPADYDERDHFAHVPDYVEYDWNPEVNVATPETVNGVVREHATDTAVIRYLQPHNPYRKLPDVHTKDDAMAYDTTTLMDAYTDNYVWVLSAIEKLLPDLEGTVAITSDHGQALNESCCGQYLHSMYHDKCSCLTTVPWFEVK